MRVRASTCGDQRISHPRATLVPVDPSTDDLKVEIVDLLREHGPQTGDELLKGVGLDRFRIIAPALRALEAEGTIARSEGVWSLA